MRLPPRHFAHIIHDQGISVHAWTQCIYRESRVLKQTAVLNGIFTFPWYECRVNDFFWIWNCSTTVLKNSVSYDKKAFVVSLRRSELLQVVMFRNHLINLVYGLEYIIFCFALWIKLLLKLLCRFIFLL